MAQEIINSPQVPGIDADQARCCTPEFNPAFKVNVPNGFIGRQWFWLTRRRPILQVQEAICNDCPVRQECEDVAVKHNIDDDHYRLWGGKDSSQIRQIIRRNRENAPAEDSLDIAN